MHHFLFFIGLLIFSCQPSAGFQGGQSIEGPEGLQELGYKEFTLFELPGFLTEVSGLSYLNDSTLLTINDEEGEFYHFNLNTGKIDQTTRFGPDDDYEGIAHLGENVFITRSNGNITSYNIRTKDKQVYKTSLNSGNNIEGLALAGNYLLLACKDKAGKDLGKDDRAIYRFNILDKTLEPDPFWWVDEDDIDRLTKEKKITFRPSGISVHPKNGKLYITSAFENRLLIVGKDQQLEQYIELDENILPQTEGVAIGNDGTLYLASEGRGKRGRILVSRK